MPDARPTKKDRLRSVPLFASLSGASLTYLAMHCREVAFEAGTTVCEQGDEGTDLLVVESGRIEARRDGSAVGSFGPGEVVGELAVLDGRPRSADLVATEAVTGLAIDHRDLRRVVLRVPALALELLAELAGRLRDARGTG